MASRRNGGAAVAAALAAGGARTVFGIPGTHNLEIYRALGGSGIAHITPRHEKGAGFAADGYARTSGGPGVCITTSGPGLTNITTALATAYADSVPLLAIAPSVPRGQTGRDVGWLHEMRDQRLHLQGLLDVSVRAETADEATAVIADAFAGWSGGRPRRRQRGGRGRTDPTDRADRRDHGDHVNGKGVLDESHPLSVGASIRLAAAQHLINEADLLLCVGTELGDSDRWGGRLTPRGTVIRIDIDAQQLHKNLPADMTLHGDARIVVEELLAALGAGPDDPTSAADRAAAVRREIETAAMARRGDRSRTSCGRRCPTT